jgi:hypothetical protein
MPLVRAGELVGLGVVALQVNAGFLVLGDRLAGVLLFVVGGALVPLVLFAAHALPPVGTDAVGLPGSETVGALLRPQPLITPSHYVARCSRESGEHKRVAPISPEDDLSDRWAFCSSKVFTQYR